MEAIVDIREGITSIILKPKTKLEETIIDSLCEKEGKEKSKVLFRREGKTYQHGEYQNRRIIIEIEHEI